MPFIPVPNVAQVQVHGRIDGQTTINDLYFRSAGPPVTLAQVQTLGLALDAWVANTILTLLSSAWTYERVRVRDLTTADSFALDIADSAGPGGSGGAFVPQNVAPCVSIRTAFAGRSARGRNYLPGVPQGVITGNTIQALFMSDITIAYNNLLPGGTYEPDGWVWSVVSRFTGNAPRAVGVSFNVVTALFTDNVVDSQRRRLPGRGI